MENDGVFGGEHSGKGVLLPSMVLRTTTMYVLQSCCGPHHDAAASFAGRVVVAGERLSGTKNRKSQHLIFRDLTILIVNFSTDAACEYEGESR